MKKEWEFIDELAQARGQDGPALREEALAIQPRTRMEEIGLHYQDRLYAMLRILKPLVVIEAGVRTGVSTRFALEALRANKRGHLVSWDPCYPSEGACYERLKETVHLNDDLIANRWTFMPHRIEEMPVDHNHRTIDIFLDDASHTEETTQWMFDNVWPMILPGGWFVCDDYRWSMLDKQHYTFERNMARLGLDWTHLGPQTAVVRKGVL